MRFSRIFVIPMILGALSTVTAKIQMGSCPTTYDKTDISYPFSTRALKLKYVDKNLVKLVDKLNSYIGAGLDLNDMACYSFDYTGNSDETITVNPTDYPS